MATNSISDVMTAPVRTVAPATSLREVAEIMRDSDLGDVLVAEEDRLVGIVTDRDVIVRCVAQGGDPADHTAGEICSSEMVTVTPRSDIREAVNTMRQGAVRRLPVVDGGRLVGVVTMGDLARVVDGGSALADVSSASPNR
ncbi:CBS domain-containing protein [Nocardiopsis lambiniae]|uniref:CBS domain-containing protein n=1 Tax=Nocardiopsis lambiniae TaxID=3075539 RepID=A0ABU2M6Z9_9ACTN|nr:CBS domain-containing protein [Nocardiopsis sp. DSM 44743]MDT0328363.1 CBS domain-containing protein [Nocardiopsis sp. DSM 44743]